MPLWEIAVLYFLGLFQGARRASSRRAWACALGFSLGLGPYSFFAWPVFFLAALCAAGLSLGRKGRKEWGAAGLLVSFLPWAWPLLFSPPSRRVTAAT